MISGYQNPEFFCDREQETEALLDALRNGRNITLIAPRRMGKSGLIHHAFYLLKKQQPKIVTLYMDIYSTQSLGDFIHLFASSVLGKLDTAPQKAMNRVGKFIKSVRPVFTLDEWTGQPRLTVDIAPAQEKNTLKEVFDYLASSEKRCYIAIDEFQQIAEYKEKGVEALLRSYIQFLPNVNFIFSGSKKHVMQEMFTSSKRPFYQSTQLLHIDTINRDAYAEFAMRHFAQNKTELPREVFDAIYDKFEGHTWYVQCVLNRLYGYNRNATIDLFALAVEQIIAERADSYADLMKAYSAGHVRLLKAIANEGCVKEILSGNFIGRHRLVAASSVNSALKKLLGNELIYQTPKGYIVYDRFMAEWLRQQPF